MHSVKKTLTLTLFIVSLCVSAIVSAQNIIVDAQTYTPQQLIEDILIDSNCIENVVVTNVVGGNFNGSDRSYGYFDATGTGFPFDRGIVMSTGRLSNVPGPNNTLSDDNATGWAGDNDLEEALNESNTINATILEFDFTSIASQVSFRYLFASEEYQENNANTCQYSDLFGFLIQEVGGQGYTNIALVPNTQTPVKVTTVHSGIPGACDPINEDYFGSWNGVNTPINFNGQTQVLTATANVVPYQTYHVKLVIADEQNYRYDSAVFLEAGSFELSVDLGPDLLRSNNLALCEGNTHTIDATQPNATNYVWYKDTIEQVGETNPTLDITEAGIYTVEVTLDNSCIAYGELIVEVSPNPIAFDSVLTDCDQNQDGITLYDLFDAEADITGGNNAYFITNFFLTENDAIQDINPIPNPSAYQNTIPNQIVYARVEEQTNCFTTAALQLTISNNTLVISTQEACDEGDSDGFTGFDLNSITSNIQSQIPAGAIVTYYESEADAISETNALSSPYQNTSAYTQTIFVKVTNNNQCFAISPINLEVLYTPTASEDETVIYCLNAFPETIRLFGGVLNDSPSNYYYEWLFNGNATSVNTSFIDINEVGNYTVIITDPNGCFASRTITVNPSNIATIENISIQEGSFNNTISVDVSGEGNYEYALDDVNGLYQASNVFTNVQPGFHTVYVRDINECGITEELVSVLGFPRFFTPNGDTVNDTWMVYGTNAQFNQGIDVKIFNRYGKLLAQFDHLSAGWNGTLNGRNLPSDDYWFVATLPNGKIYNGHFSLKR